MSVRNTLFGKAHSHPVAMGPFWQANLVRSRKDPWHPLWRSHPPLRGGLFPKGFTQPRLEAPQAAVHVMRRLVWVFQSPSL